MNSLAKAIAAFIAKGGDRSKINVPAWAQTYRVSVEDVRATYEQQMSEASQRPSNTYEIPEGK